MQIFTAKTRQRSTTYIYPQAVEVTGLQDLLAAAQYDHIFSQMKGNHRSIANFLQTDCLVLDLDNTHSEDPNEWRGIDDIVDAFPDVHFYYVQSRNYMKAKKKKDGRVQEPREKYHLYFPLSRSIVKRDGAKTALDAACIIAAKFHNIPINLAHPEDGPGLLDVGAAKPEQPMYGVEDPQGGEITGELCLDEYLRQPDVKAIWKPELAADKKTDQPDAQEDAQLVDLDWIDEAEQRSSAVWFEDWAQRHGAGLGKRYGIKQGNHKDAVAYPVRCPWSDDHTTDGGPAESVVIVDRTGKLNYKCRHAHCAGRTWTSYRQRVEELAAFTPQADLQEDQTEEDVKKAQEDYRQTAAGCRAAETFFKSPECSTAPITTGWPTLDKFLGGGLFPGLYTLGAVPSLGKTSFVLQLADSLSNNGYDVLFFSFEMTATELKAKSISRIMAQLEASRLGKSLGGLYVSQAANTGSLQHAKNARQLMNMECRRFFTSEDWELVNDALKIYEEQAQHLWIIEGEEGQPLTGKQIAEYIKRHRLMTGCRPVVFVDYLQKMQKTDKFCTDMERIENNIRDLRGAAKANSCPVLAILSYNRQGYYGSVDITSGKGSGDIEYSTDVQFGMQPVGMEEGESAKAANKALIHQTKRQPVRNLELIITKNRMGMTDKSVTFSYAAEYNTFEETGEGEGVVKTHKKRSAANRETNERKTSALERIAAALEAQEARAKTDDDF